MGDGDGMGSDREVHDPGGVGFGPPRKAKGAGGFSEFSNVWRRILVSTSRFCL